MTPMLLYAVCALILGIEGLACLWWAKRRGHAGPLDACRDYAPEEDL